MIPAPFELRAARARSRRRSTPLAEHGDDAKLLAGGHSLLPLMKLRLADADGARSTSAGSADLSYVRVDGDEVAIGARTRHHDVEHSDVARAEVPLLPHAAGQVGDPQVRHRGTIGGSLAHGDPASDLPDGAARAGGDRGRAGPGGRREIPVDGVLSGLLRDRAGARRAARRDPGAAHRLGRAGATRSSPGGPTTGRSSARRARRPGGAGQHGRHGRARHRDRGGAGRRRVDRRRRRAGRRGHRRRRRTCTPTPTTAGTSRAC